jgi:hypothetical protein
VQRWGEGKLRVCVDIVECGYLETRYMASNWARILQYRLRQHQRQCPLVFNVSCASLLVKGSARKLEDQVAGRAEVMTGARRNIAT